MSLSARRAWIEMLYPTNVQVSREVALRKESVDRNTPAVSAVKAIIVALRKESVDRNAHIMLWLKHPHMSLSARRAWIEIVVVTLTPTAIMSLSARRAWIEICIYVRLKVRCKRRSPQGERG